MKPKVMPAAPAAPVDLATNYLDRYREAKAAEPDCLLLFRMGDFYEAFDVDASVIAKTLGLAITTRDKHAAVHVPMAGFPYLQLEAYLAKLVAAGYRVALCEPAT